MMKVNWVSTSRWPNWPWWAVAVPMLWLALGGIALFASGGTGRGAPFCLFKRLTGVPCPTCGFTRGTLALFSGHPVQAWLFNPLLFSFFTVAFVWLLIRLLSGRTPAFSLNRAQRKGVWVVATLLFLMNWLYVIRYVG